MKFFRIMETKPKNRKRKAGQNSEFNETAGKLLKADEDLFQGTGKQLRATLQSVRSC